jgi:hypothetical protein
MAAKEPRHPLDKRELLHKEPADASRIDGIAKKLIDEGRYGESIEYVEVTRNAQLIDALEKAAMSEGSAFLLQSVERLRDEKVDPTSWKRVADTAMTKERFLDAVRAYAAMGDEDKAEQVRATHCPDYEPFKPLGK